MTAPRIVTLTVLSCCLGIAATAHAEDSASATAAAELVKQLQTAQLQAVATQDPGLPGRYVAALLVPGQLLVVSASHPMPDLLNGRLERGEYRELYMDLQTTPTPEGKYFIHDLGADGLHMRDRNEVFDTVYEDGSSTLTCDGSWKAQDLSEDEYKERFAAADACYRGLLDALSRTLHSGSDTQ